MTIFGTEQPRRGVNAGPGPFAPCHRWDRDFFLTYLALFWLIILMGFVPEIIHHVQRREPPYPLVVHFHAAAFVGGLVLLTD